MRKIRNFRRQNALSFECSSSSSLDDTVVEPCLDKALLQEEKSGVYIVSQTFKDRVHVKVPGVRLGSSRGGMRDLLHVEAQIKDLKRLPDFGYGHDNYLLDFF